MREIEDEVVERLGRDAGLHLLDQQVQRLGGQPSGPAHAFESLGSMQLDLPGLAAGREVGVDKGHASRMCGMGETCQLSAREAERSGRARLTYGDFPPRRQRCRATSPPARKGDKPAARIHRPAKDMRRGWPTSLP